MDPVYTWSENLVDPQRWNRYSYVRNNPLRWLDPDGRAVFPSAQMLRDVAQQVMALPRLQPTTNAAGDVSRTYCNFGTQEILRAGGDRTLDGMTAGDIRIYLADAGNATELSQADAVKYAKAGATVIMAEPRPVAVVAPEDMVKAGPSWQKKVGDKEVVKVFNVGIQNGTLNLDYAFNKASPPKAYILNADKKAIDGRDGPK